MSRCSDSIRTRAHALGVTSSSLRGRFLRGVLWSLVGAFVSRGLSMVATIAIGRLLGVKGFGEFAMIQNTLGVFGVTAGAALSQTAVRYVAEYRTSDRDRAARYISLASRLGIASGMLAAASLAVSAGWLATHVLGAPELATQLRVASYLVLFATFNGVQVGALIGLEGFGLAAGVASARGFFTVLFVISGCLLDGLNGAVIGFLVTEVCCVLITHIAMQHACRQLAIKIHYLHSDASELGELLRFALPSLLGTLVTMPAFWISSLLLINQPDGFSALGIFSGADKWRQLILFLPGAISPIVLPMLSNLHGTNNMRAFRKVFWTNVLVNVAVILVPAIVLIALSGLAMSAYGADYATGRVTLTILSGAAIASVLNTSVGQGLISLGLIWWRTSLDIGLAVLIVVLAYVLIPVYRQNGLAASQGIAYSITALALFGTVHFQFRRRRNV